MHQHSILFHTARNRGYTQYMDALYDRDVAQWAKRNAELLRNRQFQHADIDNIAEEIEDLGIGRRHALVSHLTNLAANLLKWELQPGQRSRSWQRTIVNSRNEIDYLLNESPSLKRVLAGAIQQAYPAAVRLASIEAGLDKSKFPDRCPYSIDQLLAYEYLP